MANVAVEINVSVEKQDKIEEIKAEIEANPNVKEVKVEDIGFGIKRIRVLAVVPDAEGGTENLEKSLESIDGVSGIEVVSVSRLG